MNFFSPLLLRTHLRSVATVFALAITHFGPVALAQADKVDKEIPPVVQNSALTAELFYEITVAEVLLRDQQPAQAAAALLAVARKTQDDQLYQRAAEVAWRSRNREAALMTARAWRQAKPQSRLANGSLLQILLATNRVNETADLLKTDITLASVSDRNAVIETIPRNFAQVSDKKLAAEVVEQALAGFAKQPDTSANAWATIARMRLMNDDLAGTRQAAQKAQDSDATLATPAILGLVLMDRKLASGEALVARYLEDTKTSNPLLPNPVSLNPVSPTHSDVRIGYARALAASQRFAAAIAQMQLLTQEAPERAEGWLLLGTLQQQEKQKEVAEVAFTRYVALAEVQGGGQSMAAAEPVSDDDEDAPNKAEDGTPDPAVETTRNRARALQQAYLNLAQLAQERKDFAGAESWMAKIPNAQTRVNVQVRRAALLAGQGKADEARAVLQDFKARNAKDARAIVTAEAQLLRDQKQYPAAYEVLKAAIAQTPDDADLLYEQAMLAEKLARSDEFETLLRRVMVLKPETAHAYNALGFSFADRNIRLTEAKQLIVKALSLTPDDPYIQDSLGWAEFRLGNKTQALRILEAAYQARADVEIAAHIGEVLWSLGQRTKALAMWRQAKTLGADNETLLETLKRLRVNL